MHLLEFNIKVKKNIGTQVRKKIRNIAIIAHVDHGKTTLVDELLKQSGTLEARKEVVERVMDSNDLERERGITILSKNTAIKWEDYRINIVDTPGHADFGGEVERVLSMVDSVLLLVDSVEGPMPQTRFVTEKAFKAGLNPIVVVNKIDRKEARPDWVINEVFDLFDKLGANDEQLDFPIIYTSAIEGKSGTSTDNIQNNMNALFDMLIKHVPPPKCDTTKPFLMQVSSLDYSNYVGAIAIGRIQQGEIKTNTPVKIVTPQGDVREERVLQILGYQGLRKVEVEVARAGDIVALTGVLRPRISETICDINHPQTLPALSVDEPTVEIIIQVNSSPFAGKEGKFVTSRQLKERLEKELIHNVALRVKETANPDKFKVCGRGELHLSILLETMRREGYEFAVSKPQVIFRKKDDKLEEPYENLSIDVEETNQGAIMEYLNARKGELKNIISDNKGRVRLDYLIPARSLIGFRQKFLTMTSGTGLSSHVFSHYGPAQDFIQNQRQNGVLISKLQGKATAYSIWNLQARGQMLIDPQVEVYEGMILGVNNRKEDIVINVIKGKQLTNVRASGSDENIVLTPPIRLTLEQSLDFINDDELIEITPKNIRIRKKHLKENERKRK